MSALPPALRRARALFAAVDRLLGVSRRHGSAEDLLQLFTDEARDSLDQGGCAALVGHTLRSLLDLVADRLRPRPALPPSRRAPARLPGDSPMQNLAADLRFALRTLRRQPAFTLAIVAVLAIAIGANVAIFTFVDALVLRALPYPEPERLVRVWAERDGERGNVNPLDIADYRKEAPAFAALGAWTRTSEALVGAGDPTMVSVAYATPELLATLGARAVRGRSVGIEHGRAEHEGEVVLSHALWQRLFGGDPTAIGRKVNLGGGPVTVIGVLERGFASPGTSAGREPEIWRPYVPEPDAGRVGHFMTAVGRLAPGASIAEARTQLEAISRRIEAENPATNRGLVGRPEPLAASFAGAERPIAALLSAAVGALLLVACVNVAHLLLARAAGRQQELAVRASLGAGRGRLVRQLLVESALLAAAASILGTALAWLATRSLSGALTAELPTTAALRIDSRALLFALLLATLTVALFGLAPALSASRFDLRRAFAAARQTVGVAGTRFRTALLVIETALALVLLVGAALLVGSSLRLARVPPGFDTERTLTFRLSLPAARYDHDQRVRLFEELNAKLAALPGVDAVGAVNMAPLSGRYSCDSFGLDDRPAPPEGTEPCAESRVATVDYFRAMGIEQIAGRRFAATDRSDTLPVAVISETMARRWWPEADPLGRRIRWGSATADGPWWTIVGVVADVKFFGLDADAAPEIYMPHAQWQARTMTVALRTARDPEALAAEARAAVAALDPELPLFELATTRELVARSTLVDRFRTTLVAAFASVALLLALVGIHGVMAFHVAARRQEIGIRKSLGASVGALVWPIVRRGLGATAAGAALGLALSVGLSDLLERFLFGVGATDPRVLIGAPLALLAAAGVAALVPALRVARIDPVEALRAE